jgi:hypothetical protein
MDEALAAQTVVSPVPPQQRLLLHAIQLLVFTVYVTEMAKLGPECSSVNHK